MSTVFPGSTIPKAAALPSLGWAGWSLTAVWTRVWCSVVLWTAGTLSPAVCTETHHLQSAQQEHKEKNRRSHLTLQSESVKQINPQSLPAAVTVLVPPPSVGLFLSLAPPGGRTPVAVACCSPAVPSGSAHAQPAAPSAASESEDRDALTLL